ncbi:tagaturonate reductase [Spirosomataceae bacterium TFI 002]|nr:tagaturonate reductase [Spirosomataceae bacterium TFI 002]
MVEEIVEVELLSNSYLQSENPSTLLLPEKVLQFGTGVLLRGLPGLIIHEANEKGDFNGRIAMVKSTNNGSIEKYVNQDCLYTVGIRGVQKGKIIDKKVLCSSTCRLLTASEEWSEIIKVAQSKDLEVVFSNTTEIGISYLEEFVGEQNTPQSFPGKLLACLKARFDFYNGDDSKGLVILPTELISDNGTKLKNIVSRLAEYNQFSASFLSWLENANHFCNTLVDRIVPGSLSEEDLRIFNEEMPYYDENPIVVEPYALWAIEGDEEVARKLSFCNQSPDAIVVPSIENYKEIKLRILNGTHTFISGYAFLSGFNLVKEAMADEGFKAKVEKLLFDEIIPSMVKGISLREKKKFAKAVLDRFSNPFIEHQWHAICFNYTLKMVQRSLPLLNSYVQKNGKAPELMSCGLAAMIRFSQPLAKDDKGYFGMFNGKRFKLNDPATVIHSEHWKGNTTNQESLYNVLSDTRLWNEDLTQIKGLKEAVWACYSCFNQLPVREG